MKKIIFLFCIIALIGCATTSVNLYKNSLNYEPTNPKNVKIFHKPPQDREFIEIGEITVSRAYDWKTVEKLLKTKASELGGDAVYVISKAEKQEGYMGGYGYIFGAVDTQLIITGVVIKYK